MGLIRKIRTFRRPQHDAKLSAFERDAFETKLENEITRTLASTFSSLSSGFIVAGSISVVISQFSIIINSVQKADPKVGMPQHVVESIELAQDLGLKALGLGLILGAIFLIFSLLILARSIHPETD